MTKKINKTNAMRLLDKCDISYDIHTYDNRDNMVDGVTVAHMIKKDKDMVFKTIVTQSKSDIYVFVLPVAKELNLKKCATAVNEKHVSLVEIKKIVDFTGYIKGGCSPLGMKKVYQTVFDETAILFDRILFNAGKVGILIEIETNRIKDAIDISFFDICQ